ncbi:MAG: radical SAM protein [Rhodospirillaceae bacterium]|nr:MAG: radical SAM protein [Rhodospirillaceae bacterium]
MKKFICKHPWTHFEVNNPNGEVTMCCNNDTVLGNVNDEPIADIWNGNKFSRIRKRMVEEGAHAFCPHTCPVLQGGKKYENLDWYKELDPEGPIRENAEKNEQEYDARKTVLETKPRWVRFTYSYACNLDCYHCYQREDATQQLKLPSEFMDQLPEYVETAQIVYPFGGEPFFFSPVIDFLASHNTNTETRFLLITNATLLTDKVFEILERVPISTMAASLDAANARSFDALRVRGRNANWDQVVTNLGRIADLRKRKDFEFTVSMTLNSVNALEIEDFVDLALSFDAEPLIMLVANPYETRDFQRNFLLFTPPQFDEMEAQISQSLVKVRKKALQDAEIYLEQLLIRLKEHRSGDNDPVRYATKQAARKVFRRLPEQVQDPLRRVVQNHRRNASDKAKQ